MTVKAASSLPETMAFRGDAPVVARSRPVEAGGRADAKPLRVAIVHYWLVSMRGGEKVVEELCRMFPQADIFTLVYNPERTSDFLNSRNIHTSFLQKIPRSTRHYTKMLPLMKERGWGRVITSTSSGVVAPIPNLGISNSLRLALVGWSKTLAREIGRDGVTANIVLPGRIATGRITFLDEQKAKRENRPVEEVTAESTAAIPVGRYGRPEEYGDTVAFLASPRASYITGSVIRIDGGLIQSI